MQYHQRESERKPRTRRGGKDNPPVGGPRCGAVSAGRVEPTPQTQYSIYSGRERLGSYRVDGATFTAFDRLGREIGIFASEREAIAAIDPSEAP